MSRPTPLLAEPAELPDSAGCYALIIDLQHPLRVLRPRAKQGGKGAGLAPELSLQLPPGRYVYGGSARGPGGIRSRVLRHLRQDKRRHWHIDQLTCIAGVTALWAGMSLTECDIVARMAALPDASIPIPGFGSSDCRRCRSHLVALSPDTEIEDIFRKLADGLTWISTEAIRP